MLNGGAKVRKNCAKRRRRHDEKIRPCDVPVEYSFCVEFDQSARNILHRALHVLPRYGTSLTNPFVDSSEQCILFATKGTLNRVWPLSTISTM